MIVVVGPGAVGGLIAAVLHRAGQEVTVVARPATADRIAEHGIAVRSAAFGDWTAPVLSASAIPSGAPTIVAVKAYGLTSILPDLRQARPVEVLSLLNGLRHAQQLKELPDPDRVACGSIAVESAREQGVIHHRSPFCAVTVPDGTEHWQVTEALRAAGLTVRTGGTEQEVLWRKLRFLSPMALLTSWAQEPLGAALDRDEETTNALLAEMAELATAAGVPTTAAELLEILRGMPATMRSSLQLDIRAGTQSELDVLGADLVAAARHRQIATPVLARLVAELRLLTS